MLVRCLYASRPVDPMNGALLDGILEQSRRNNPRQGITGILCVADDLYIQLLEGGRDEVCEIFNAIVRDDRHRQVRLLSYEEISERRFGNWSMGHVSIPRVNPSLLLKYFKRTWIPSRVPARPPCPCWASWLPRQRSSPEANREIRAFRRPSGGRWQDHAGLAAALQGLAGRPGRGLGISREPGPPVRAGPLCASARGEVGWRKLAHP